MLLVETVLERGEGSVVCRCRVGRDTPLAGESGISSMVALELGAQTSALVEDAAGPNTTARSGYLVSIRRATLHRPTLPLEVPLRVEARIVGRAGGLQIVRVRIASEDEPERTLAEAELGTFRPAV
jgi:predicted hotdog family 3-hydroxylacyl-ACP dehydratase